MEQTGKLIAILGSTGSGKGVLIEYIRSIHPEFIAPVSLTTRAMRPGEIDGVHYHFVSEEEFKKHIAEDEFIEWVQFAGNYYGSLKKEIVPYLEQGKIVLDEFDLDGVQAYRKLIPPKQFVSILIDAGSWDELERRVRARAPITEDELQKRKERYEKEVLFRSEATYVVQNLQGELERAKKDIANVLDAILLS